MKNSNTKIRIKDIAQLAGVSEGTVDRVLHDRGEVSVKSKEAVTKVLNEMNYSPNILARSLASKKQYYFACLIPEFKPQDYWESIESGFDAAARDFSQYNVNITKYYYNQFDVNSFESETAKILLTEPDAVIIAPIFREETFAFGKVLTKRNIPFSFVDSLIEDADFHTYYGQNSVQSGYIAAKLLLQSLSDNAQVVVIRTKRNGALSNQTINRYRGFLNYIDENHLNNIQLINVEFVDGDENSNYETLQAVFLENTNIKAAITFNSKVFKLAKHLVNLKHHDVQLIGYDLLAQNVEYLEQDIVSYLIAQRPDKQAFLTIRDMCQKLIFNQEVARVNYVPIDVLIKENIEDYVKFRE